MMRRLRQLAILAAAAAALLSSAQAAPPAASKAAPPAGPSAAGDGLPAETKDIVAGLFDLAMRAAAANGNNAGRFQAGLVVARAQADARDPAAKSTFAQLAAAAAKFVEGDEDATATRRVWGLVTVARVQCQTGMTTEGRALVAQAEALAGAQPVRLVDVIEGRAQCGLTTAEAINKLRSGAGKLDDEKLDTVIRSLAAIDQEQLALDLSEHIRSLPRRALAVVRVGEALKSRAETGAAENAFNTAQKLLQQSRASGSPDPAQGPAESALRSARTDPQLTMAGFAYLLEVAGRLNAAGDRTAAQHSLDRAQRVLRDMESGRNMPGSGVSLARRDLAIQRAAIGDVAGAVRLAGDIDDPNDRAVASGHIAAARARAGDIGNAEAAARPLTGEAQIVARIALAGAYLKAGRIAEMRRTIAAIVPAVQTLQPPIYQATLFAEAAKSLRLAMR